MITITAFAVIVALFFFNAKKYFKQNRVNTPRKSVEMPNPLKPIKKETPQKNAPIQRDQNFAGGYKPENVAKWEAEFFELTRNMSNKIDAKMSALTTLTNDANRVCQRMETLAQKLDEQLASLKSLQNNAQKTPDSENGQNKFLSRNFDIAQECRDYEDNTPHARNVDHNDTSMWDQPSKAFRQPLPKAQPSSLIPPLDFSDDLSSLAELGAGILSDNDYPNARVQSDRKVPAFPGVPNAGTDGRSPFLSESEHRPPVAEKSISLGELLFQEKKSAQSTTRDPQQRVLSPLRQNSPSVTILKANGDGFVPLKSANGYE